MNHTYGQTHPLWDRVEIVLCRTIGCSSPLAHLSEWPHRFVCTPFVNWRYKP